MARKLMLWKTKGINQDLSVSAFNPEFAFENRNLRLSTNEGNTLLSWVNEKGTEEIFLYTTSNGNNATHLTTISGTPVGVAVINHKIILFTASSEDYIYKLYYSNEIMMCDTLYHGHLNFSTNNPLETLVSYESDNVQKVYWTDGINQPRVINIENPTGRVYDDNSFDFIPELPFNETVKVVKLLGANGMFAPGVIQYAFTYFYKYGQETNIFYTTPLYYISPKDRGGSPEEKIDNAFKITIDINASNSKFDYLRIYSIQRTSVNSTPIVKRIQDVKLRGLTATDEHIIVSFTDTGTVGDTIDPTELLYKGGESIKALTMELKDGTLFLGNLLTRKHSLTKNLRDLVKSAMINLDTGIKCSQRYIFPQLAIDGAYYYLNQLTSFGAITVIDNSTHQSTIGKDISRTVPCGGFKHGDYYRLGLQFQHKNGWWSEPIEIWDSNGNDWQQEEYPEFDIDHSRNRIALPIFAAEISIEDVYTLRGSDYRAVRPVAVFPNILDRETICQGVACPTVYNNNQRGTEGKLGDLYAQSSWFFRPGREAITDGSSGERPPIGVSSDTAEIVTENDIRDIDTAVSPMDVGEIPYLYRSILKDNNTIAGTDTTAGYLDRFREVEVQGYFSENDRFNIDRKTVTLHSPDIEFDNLLQVADYTTFAGVLTGHVRFTRTFSDIDIQTETPPISNKGSGFIHKSMLATNAKGIITGLFYDDFIVDDNDLEYEAYKYMYCPVKWPVYPWQLSGSLNNDTNRPSDKGVASALLKKKVISNLRYSTTEWLYEDRSLNIINPLLFSSDESSILKSGDKIYRGNIDTLLTPSLMGAFYFAFNSSTFPQGDDVITDFSANIRWRLTGKDKIDDKTIHLPGFDPPQTITLLKEVGGTLYYNGSSWGEGSEVNDHIGDDYADLAWKKSPVRMKYKSTPHLVLTSETITTPVDTDMEWNENCLPIVEIRREINHNTIYGGKSEDALRENIWIPAGEPVILKEGEVAPVKWEYGDTYYQRWDCLKTYPFTKEDINLVVEIGSFMLETRVNIDGRYDRNRGQMNNLNMTPLNFNLLNPVYSLIDNFFNYKITEIPDSNTKTEDTARYPNYVTWSKTKEAGADVDLWTNITMASILDLDGDKGEITSLQRLDNLIICFLDSSISLILYNEKTLITTTDGVPVELANSGKVLGKRYISNTVGCSNKWSIVTTPSGIYFMDSNDKSIYLFNGQLSNISLVGGFDAWCKLNIPSLEMNWTPNRFENFIGVYDRINQDVLFINNKEALAWSERLKTFTSFYDYGNSPFFVNLDDEGIWIRSNGRIWKHQGSNEYCRFFDVNVPYSMTLIGNPEPQLDKIFTNLEFRACVNKDGIEDITGKYNFYLPFDSLEVWNEYLHGYTLLSNKLGHSAMVHYDDSSFSLKRKFRIWRCDIPRNNYELLTYPEREEGETEEHYLERVDAYNDWLEGEAEKGIYRHSRKPLDRMRNPWIYIKLQKLADDSTGLPKAEVHDIVMTYFK